jgi:precorrin-8X/cobalt-precorrin-8 methylmutase
MTVHPIEAQSMRIVAERADLSGYEAAARPVVERVVHASADLDYARTMVVDSAAVRAGVDALQAGCDVVTDVEMVRHGLSGVLARCYLNEVGADAADGAPTRSAAGIRMAAERHPAGAVFVVGCAPTALMELIRLAGAGRLSPALVIGLPVGFVGAADSKMALRASGLTAITNVGDKGGAAVASAAFNAIRRMAHDG